MASAHEPYERCGTGVPVRRLSATATPGERVALSFDVAANAGPLTIRAMGDIGDWLDVWVVKVWEQAGVGVYGAPGSPLPSCSSRTTERS